MIVERDEPGEEKEKGGGSHLGGSRYKCPEGRENHYFSSFDFFCWCLHAGPRPSLGIKGYMSPDPLLWKFFSNEGEMSNQGNP